MQFLRTIHQTLARKKQSIVDQMTTHVQQFPGFDEKPLKQISKASKVWRSFPETKNMKFLGHGAYASVYRWNNTAIKFSINDKCWDNFVLFIQTQNSPHLPKILDYRQIKLRGVGTVAVTQIELLTEVPNGDIIKYSDQAAALFFITFNEEIAEKHSRSFPGSQKDLGILVNQLQAKYDIYSPNQEPMRRYLKSHRKQSKLLQIISQIPLPQKCLLDLFPENFMLRGKTLVINDPVLTLKGIAKL